MSPNKRQISRDDILSMEEYASVRKERRAALVEKKRNRRMEVGPYVTFYFESFDTMWHQIHEMLFIEKGGEEQIQDELAAYNPLIPNGSEFVATMMFEIDDPVRRASILSRLGGVEESVVLKIGDEDIRAVAEEDVDRTTADGKASSVHFLHFPLSTEHKAAFSRGGIPILLSIEQEGYQHMAVMPEAVQRELASDLD